MNNNCGIYMIKSPSNRIYIGQSKNIDRRFNEYIRRSPRNQIKLFNSFVKYGVKNHLFSIIEFCNEEELNIKERYWQEFYNSIENGLNCVYVNTDIKPSKFGIESSKRRSRALKGIKKKYPVWNKDKRNIYSKEVLLKMSLSKIGKPSKSKGKKRPSITGENHYYFNKKRPDFSENQTGDKNHMYGKIAPNAKTVINTITNEEFPSIRFAAQFYNIKESTLRCKINGQRKNNTNLKFKD